jgi:hypothetical protein
MGCLNRRGGLVEPPHRRSRRVLQHEYVEAQQNARIAASGSGLHLLWREGKCASRNIGRGCGPLEFFHRRQEFRRIEATRATEVDRQIEASQRQGTDAGNGADGVNVLDRRFGLDQEIAAGRVAQTG